VVVLLRRNDCAFGHVPPEPSHDDVRLLSASALLILGIECPFFFRLGLTKVSKRYQKEDGSMMPSPFWKSGYCPVFFLKKSHHDSGV
jgi:hypothetical protein